MSYRSLERIREVTDRNVLNLQEAKEAGKKVVGQYCIYSPDELAIAAGAIPVSLCGTKQDSIPAAEEILPRSLCPLIKSSFGFALQDSCPYLSASDVVVADSTCDGKKKMYELLSQFSAPVAASAGRRRPNILAWTIPTPTRTLRKNIQHHHQRRRSAPGNQTHEPDACCPEGCS